MSFKANRQTYIFQGFIFGTLFALIFIFALTPDAHGRKKKKKVIYRKYTQLDFSGESVQGKIRAPEVFYIFQRRRLGTTRASFAPSGLNHHRGPTLNNIKGALPK